MTTTLFQLIPWIGIGAGLFWVAVCAVVAFGKSLLHVYSPLGRTLYSLLHGLVAPRDWQKQ